MSDRNPLPWRVVAQAVIVRVRLTPRAGRDAIDGIEPMADGPVVKARVRAVAEDGKANAALEALIADALGVAKSSVRVVGGQTSRGKSVAISGDPVQIDAKLRARLKP